MPEDDLASASVRIDPDLSYFKDDLRSKLAEETDDEKITVPVDPKLDTSGLDRAKAETDAAVKALGSDAIVKIKAEVDTASIAEAKAEEEGLKEDLDHTNESMEHGKEIADTLKDSTLALGDSIGNNLVPNLSKAGSAASDAGEGLGALWTAAIALGPALVPIGAVALAGIASIGPLLVAAGAGLGAFALAASSQLGPLKTELSSVVSEFQKLAAPEVLPVINNALGLIGPVFARLYPLVGTTASELEHLENAGKAALQAPFWTEFSGWVDQNAGPALSSLATFAGGIVKMFAGVSIAFTPIIHDIEGGLDGLSNRLASWGQGLNDSSGFQSFLHYVEMEAPVVGNLLTNLGGTLKNLIVGLAPIGAVVLEVVTGITDFTNALTSISPILTTAIISVGLLAFAYTKLSGPISDAVTGLGVFRSAVANVMVDGTAGIGGLEGGLAGLVGGLGGLAAVAPVAIGALAIGAGIFAIAKASADNFNGSVQALVGNVEQLPTKTLPQLGLAISATVQQLAAAKQAGDEAGKSWGSLQALYGIQHEPASSAVQELTKYLKELRGEEDQQNANIGTLQNQFGVSRQSVLQLADSLNINLSKALNPSEVDQFGAALAGQASQAGVAESALSSLAKTAGTTTAQITTDVTNAVNATKQSWASYGSAVTAFSGSLNVTGGQISQFYAEQELQGATFTQNVQKAIKDGFDPRLISQIIQAGPAQASQLLQGLVSAQGSGLQTLVTQSLNAMAKEGGEAVEQARLTQEAVSSKSSAMAANLGTALAISQDKTAQNATALLGGLASTLSGGRDELVRIAASYGITLPQGILDGIPATKANAQAQVNAYLQALAGAKTGAQQAALGAAQTLPNAVNSQAAAAKTAGQSQLAQFYAGLLANKAGAQTAGHDVTAQLQTSLGDTAATKVAGKKQGDDAGTAASSSTKPKEAGTKLASDLATALGDTKGATAAGQKFADEFLKGVAADDAAAKTAGDKLATAVGQSLTAGSGTMDAAARTAARGVMDTIVNVIQNNIGAVTSASAQIGAAVATAINAKDADARSAATSMVNAFINEVNSGKGKANTSGTDLSEAVRTGILTVDLGPTGKSFVDKFTSSLSDTGPVRAAGVAAGNAAADGAKSTVGQFSQIGVSMIQGITAGAENAGAVAGLKAAVASAASQGLAAGKQKIQSSSPSILFANEMGLPIIQGIAKGITDNAGLLGSALGKVVDQGRASGASLTGSWGAPSTGLPSPGGGYLVPGAPQSAPGTPPGNLTPGQLFTIGLESLPPGVNPFNFFGSPGISPPAASDSNGLPYFRIGDPNIHGGVPTPESPSAALSAITALSSGYANQRAALTVTSNPVITINTTGTSAEIAASIAESVQTALATHDNEMLAELNAL